MGLFFIIIFAPLCLSECVVRVHELVSGELFFTGYVSWLRSIAEYFVPLAAGLWFFFGTRQVISILMRGRFAAHCCQHCGYDPGPHRPERCPECARAFPVNQGGPPSSKSTSS